MSTPNYYAHVTLSIRDIVDISIKKTEKKEIMLTGPCFTIFTSVDVLSELTRLSSETKIT